MTLQFDSLASFFAMNGHGGYVWAAYGITFVVLTCLVISPIVQRRQFFSQQKKLQKLAQQ